MSKRKVKRAWWQKPKNIRRMATGGVSLVVVVLGILYFALGSGSGGARETTILRPFTPAKSFTLPTTDGTDVESEDYFGKGNVLLYFSEGVGCAPCFDQIVDLEADWDRFEAMGLKMVSVMVDPLDQLKPEINERGIKGIVAADVDKTVSNEYDAMEASMHPGVKPGHTFILVDVNGNVTWRWDWGGHGQAMYVEVDDLYDWLSRELGAPG